MDPLQPLEEAAERALRNNQLLVLIGVLVMLDEVQDIEEAKARIEAVMLSLTE